MEMNSGRNESYWEHPIPILVPHIQRVDDGKVKKKQKQRIGIKAEEK